MSSKNKNNFIPKGLSFSNISIAFTSDNWENNKYQVLNVISDNYIWRITKEIDISTTNYLKNSNCKFNVEQETYSPALFLCKKLSK